MIFLSSCRKDTTMHRNAINYNIHTFYYRWNGNKKTYDALRHYSPDKENWKFLSQWAHENNKIFVPCVGPGYSDDRVRPWNKHNYKDRENGGYYDKMFRSAIESKPTTIRITSFNEWHEGTQIEPAIPKTIESFTYEDYHPLETNYYLKRTKSCSIKF